MRHLPLWNTSVLFFNIETHIFNGTYQFSSSSSSTAKSSKGKKKYSIGSFALISMWKSKLNEKISFFSFSSSFVYSFIGAAAHFLLLQLSLYILFSFSFCLKEKKKIKWRKKYYADIIIEITKKKRKTIDKTDMKVSWIDCKLLQFLF